MNNDEIMAVVNEKSSSIVEVLNSFRKEGGVEMTCPYCGGRLERHPYSESYSCDTCEYDQETLVTNPDKGFLDWCERMSRAPVTGALDDYEEWVAAMPR